MNKAYKKICGLAKNNIHFHFRIGVNDGFLGSDASRTEAMWKPFWTAGPRSLFHIGFIVASSYQMNRSYLCCARWKQYPELVWIFPRDFLKNMMQSDPIQVTMSSMSNASHRPNTLLHPSMTAIVRHVRWLVGVIVCCYSKLPCAIHL